MTMETGAPPIRARHARKRRNGMPSLFATTREYSGITLVDLSGRISLGDGSALLRKTVRDLLEEGKTKIILNLGDVNYIDSSGIGELVSGFTAVRIAAANWKLLNLTKKVNDLLQITKLFTVFDVFNDKPRPCGV